jgi:hypothetical protein
MLGKRFRRGNILDDIDQQSIGIFGDKMTLAPIL